MRTGVGAIVAAGVLAGLTACSFSFGGFDQSKAESEIETGIAEQTGFEATVVCPEDPDWVVGETFECTAEFEPASEPVIVTMTTDDYDIEWRLDYVDVAEVAESVAADFTDSLGVAGLVTCAEYAGLGLADGDPLECTLELPNGDRTAVQITIGDPLDWNAPGVVDVAKAESVIRAGIREQTGIIGQVECGEDLYWAGDGTKRCELTGEEVFAPIDVTLLDDGNLNWELR